MKAIHNSYERVDVTEWAVVNIIKSKNESNSQQDAYNLFGFTRCCKYH